MAAATADPAPALRGGAWQPNARVIRWLLRPVQLAWYILAFTVLFLASGLALLLVARNS